MADATRKKLEASSVSNVEKLRRHLKSGQVYRRAELAEFSTAVDRHLRQLMDAGELRKLKTGVYYRPKKCVFGEVPPEADKVVASFLKDDDFLVMSLNTYNGMGFGTTQLYNERLVYNHKRDGHMELDGQKFFFLKNRRFPKKPTDEFLLVDLINNVEFLTEDKNALKERVAQRAWQFDKDKVLCAARSYGKVATRKYFEQVFRNRTLAHAG